ncbi:MAG TPA: DUF397 domain-containing protein [Pseudonocardiaceae bacterium]|jgi:hypothetical protein|nr:DUF397 domain-containing protein [Pseudonocardiaceae bacterium]
MIVSASETEFLVWRKSSRSGGGNDCVEMAVTEKVTAVRDSKNSTGPRLTFGPLSWTEFLDQLSR